MLSSTTLIFPLEIVKFAFFVVYIAATIGVIVGVYWEGDQFDKGTQQRGWRLLIRSLAIDTLFTVLIFSTDGWISSIQRNEIVALEKKLAPRILDDEQRESLVAILKHFPGQRYQISVAVGSETSTFACSLNKILKSGGWIEPTITAYGLTTELCDGTGAEVNLASAIHIRVKPNASEDVKAAALSLANALKSDGVEAYAETDPLHIQDPANIAVMVGAKL